ncbi:HesA/MoeB/ThiF family protein [Celeribacter sp.]|uniref:HesA/MoeB/ThiF family protein n=1 Tax=Celeribacter sp. TaxID=1890673 RepID=UPI003A8DCB1C
MVVFLLLVACLWGIGALTGAPSRARWAMIGVLYVAVLLAVMISPENNPFGGTVGEWALLGGGAALVVAYRFGLSRLRARVEKYAPETPETGPFREAELERYMRHIILRDIGGVGQRKLKEAKVLVVGAGGLGSPVLQYLAASGVGTIGVMDDDVVEASNLQRQVIHTDERLGMPKVFSAEMAMTAQNPFVEVRPYNKRLDESCRELIAEYDLVLDGTDNFATRYLVNRLCVENQTPLIAAAITQWEGQISTYNSDATAPCFQCIFPQQPPADMVLSCSEAGVAAPLPGVLGTMMAMEAIKHITGAGQGLSGRLVIHDALYAETRTISVKKRADCPICGG